MSDEAFDLALDLGSNVSDEIIAPDAMTATTGIISSIRE